MSYDEKTLLQWQNDYVVPTYAPENVFVRGQGSWLWELNGQRYLDFSMGISVCNLGHCHPALTKAISEQAAKLVHISNLFYNEKQSELAALIAKNSFGGKVFFCNSGAEANEGMIKFARRWGSQRGNKRFEIICAEDSFHGRTLATLAATGRTKYRQGYQPDMPGFTFAKFNDLESMRAAVTANTVAIMVEPVQGEGGIHPSNLEFLTGLRQLCDEKELLLLFDEVQCGMGRTGKFFAHQHYNIIPDAMSLAKALGNGFPMGAFELRSEHADVFAPGSHASTFGGGPLACAAGIAVFETFAAEKVLENVQKQGAYLKKKLQDLKNKHAAVGQIRILGLMVGVELGKSCPAVIAACRKKHLLVLSAGEGVLRLLPSLLVSREEIDQAVAIIAAALQESEAAPTS